MLPAPKGTATPYLAQQLGYESAFFASQIESTLRFLQDGWRAAKEDNVKLHKGAKLTIRTYDAVPAYEMYWVDKYVALSIPSALMRQASDDGMLLLFDRTRGTFPARWIERQLARADLPLEWENKVD